ncbi:MAG: acyl-CoA thioesterase [Leptolyngbyaceae cyanobacterium SM2_5_2]|nr:acyl-CoA thioesterase [Leptolyngbyaceae cyanobacterium SM2_5_2]
MGFSVNHRVRFQETDAAGVVYFANGLALCHAAYEDSLLAAGINLAEFFSPSAEAVYPIVHASMDYRRPMRCGEVVVVSLAPYRLDASSFEISYRLQSNAAPPLLLAEALTRHVCIHPQRRDRQPLGAAIEHWLQRWAT